MRPERAFHDVVADVPNPPIETVESHVGSGPRKIIWIVWGCRVNRDAGSRSGACAACACVNDPIAIVVGIHAPGVAHLAMVAQALEALGVQPGLCQRR